MAASPQRRTWLVLLVLIVVVAVGIGIFLWQRNASRIDVAELVSLKDRAVGLAENGTYAEAEKLLMQLAKDVPDEPVVLRNLAIVRIGPIEDASPEDLTDPAKRATFPPPSAVALAIEGLLLAEPENPVSHILAARGAMQLARIEAAEAATLPDPLISLQKAASLDPKNAAVRFELYDLVKGREYQQDEKAQQAGRKAIAEAYRLEPRNVTLFLELIKTQAEAQDPELIKTLEGAQQLLAPIRPLLLRQRSDWDIEQARLDVIRLAKEGNWQSAKVEAQRRIFNILNIQVVQRSDRLRVKVGALEYLLRDFSDAFYQQYGRPPAPAFADTNVKFVKAAAALPKLADIRDLRLADVDLDGRLDLVVLHGTKLSVLSRVRGKQDWELLLASDVREGMERLIVADLDRDVATLTVGEGGDEKKTGDDTTEEFRTLQRCEQAFPDFLLYGSGGIAIVRNTHAGAAAQTAPSGGLLRKLAPVELTEELAAIGAVTAAAVVDFDHDQDLDLVLGEEEKGLRLWRMLGNGTFKFEDYTQHSVLPKMDGMLAGLSIGDWDRDLYTDIFVAYDASQLKGVPAMPLLLKNQRHGQFLGETLGTDFQSLGNLTALVPVEIDGNGSWDLVGLGQPDHPLSEKPSIQSFLTTTPAPGKVSFLKSLPAVSANGKRLLTWDYDNDAHVDLLVWGEGGATILRGTPDGFKALDAGKIEGVPTEGLVAVDYGDLDGDHDLDLVAATADTLVQIDNDGGSAHRGLIFYVTGSFNGQNIGANNSAIGTVVEVRTPGRYQAQVITRQPLHVGLGPVQQPDLVRMIFTNGIPRTAEYASAHEIFCEKQKLAGSCPFVYMWNGQEFKFFTDCLWAAPIGLQVAEGQMAPSRAWEYLLIPGERLKERDGTYDLQLTEELWEAAYFDQVRLIAVDHPQDTDLYTNEKVGGPDIAAPKLHLVQLPRRPAAARDKHGRDVLPKIAQRDDDYLQGFDGHITQGLVDEHFLELDLGQLDSRRLITLFLTGWIHPTNTSINVNLSQHPELAYPRLPYVQVADGSGGWKEVQAFMGFPGGKTKTIAVELPAAAFVPGQWRLRICTSAEIYWDDVFFTVDEEPVVGEVPQRARQEPLELVSADLHYRGFSAELPHPPSAPLRFDYSVVSTAPKWAPMGGYFTRYGDVSPLLNAADDQMVVMGSGDEMTVRFRAPKEPPPPGWKRDFILYSVGWDKDADLNTVCGQTAEPLPYNAMPAYPYPADQPFPDTPAHREYLRKFQTRQQPHQRFWRQLSR